MGSSSATATSRRAPTARGRSASFNAGSRRGRNRPHTPPVLSLYLGLTFTAPRTPRSAESRRRGRSVKTVTMSGRARHQAEVVSRHRLPEPAANAGAVPAPGGQLLRPAVGTFDLDLEVGEDERDEEEVSPHHKRHETAPVFKYFPLSISFVTAEMMNRRSSPPHLKSGQGTSPDVGTELTNGLERRL